MPPEVRPTIAAIVPHWNRQDLLPSFFKSLGRQQRPFDEVIVVDNGSTDDSVAIAESFGARVLRLDRNLGFAGAVNRGIETTQADWVAILNNDVTLHPNWLARLLERTTAPSVSFATGKTLNSSDTTIVDGTYDEISRGACSLRCGAGKPDSPLWNQERTIRFAPMTAALFRRDLFTEVGSLDESFGSYLEDVDFGIRCAANGKSGLYIPAATAYHRGSSTLGRWSPDTVWHISRNQIFLAAKHYKGQPCLPIVAGQVLWGLVALRHGTGVAYLRGKIAGYLEIRQWPRRVTGKSLTPIFEASEKEILAVQRQTGFDTYWRAYFWLARP